MTTKITSKIDRITELEPREQGHLIRVPAQVMMAAGELRALGREIVRGAQSCDAKVTREHVWGTQVDWANRIFTIGLTRRALLKQDSTRALLHLEFKLVKEVPQLAELVQAHRGLELFSALLPFTDYGQRFETSPHELQHDLDMLAKALIGVFALTQRDHGVLQLPLGLILDEDSGRRTAQMAGHSCEHTRDRRRSRRVKALMSRLWFGQGDSFIPLLVHLTRPDLMALPEGISVQTKLFEPHSSEPVSCVLDRFALSRIERPTQLELERQPIHSIHTKGLKLPHERGRQANLALSKLHPTLVQMTQVEAKESNYVLVHPELVDCSDAAFALGLTIFNRQRALAFGTTRNKSRIDQEGSFEITLPTLLSLSGTDRHEQPWRVAEEVIEALKELKARGFLADFELPTQALALDPKTLERTRPIRRRTLEDKELKVVLYLAEPMLEALPVAALQKDLRAQGTMTPHTMALPLLIELQRRRRRVPRPWATTTLHRPLSWRLKPPQAA